MLATAAILLMEPLLSKAPATDTATCEMHLWGTGRPKFKPRAPSR